jgi:cytochrome oxidase Cu insertion factor (SCO1/SenC/PrrC family)
MTINQQRTAAIVAIITLVTVAPLAEGDEDMLAVGGPFVDFALAAHDGSTVTSTDLAGRPYLLFYYPKADTPG